MESIRGVLEAMMGHLVGRVVSSLVSLFIFVSLLFVLAHLLIPGDFVTQFSLGMGAEQEAALREQLGLNDPLWRQYITFVGALLVGDFWTSYQGQSVASTIFFFLPVTLVIFTMAMGVAFPFGFWLGKTMAWRRDRKARSVLTIGAVAFHTAFPPLLAFILIVAFDRIFGRRAFLSMARVTLETAETASSTWRSILLALVVGIGAAAVVDVWRRRVRAKEWARVLPWITGLTVPVAVLVLRGDWVAALDILFWLSLPIIVVALLSVGEVTLIVDGAMAGVAREDYIFTARAKGLSEREVRDRHASRMALLPAFSKLLVSLPFFLTGLMIIETAFAQPRYIEMAIHVPGLSSLMFSSLEARNVPIVIGGLLFVGLIMLALRLLLDVLTLYLDPRIRYASSQGGG